MMVLWIRAAAAQDGAPPELRPDGSVWAWSGRWVEVLPAPADAAARLRDVELELEAPDLPSFSDVEDGEIDLDEYARLLRDARRDADADRARQIERLRDEVDAGARPERALWGDADGWWVVREDGGWRSADGGATWEPAAGPRHPPRPPPSRPSGAPPFVPAERLIAGADADDPGRPPLRRWAALVPHLALVGQWYQRGEDWVGVGGGQQGWLDGEVVLTWGLSAAALPEHADLVEIDGQWWVDDGVADPVLAAALVRRGARLDGAEVARIHALLAERAAVAGPDPGGGLLAETLRALERAEIEARLDAVSGGAVSAWIEQGEP